MSASDEEDWTTEPPKPGDPIDWTDPCARAQVLREAYYRLVSGTNAYQITYKANGVERSVSYSVVDKASLLNEIRQAEADCGKGTPTRRRFAIRAGSRRVL
jgi:hypothetical protein